eukprot:TRINITY_DN4387_c0_g1_i1.p1 TRINITY_DN4387_c0_g1~~TRINITY_DN4387_c0_g1_i1.p1  ORF type:complete len:214 (-),score=29.92 TRINITY_DN4387_c0_g1_i1:102-743(-)
MFIRGGDRTSLAVLEFVAGDVMQGVDAHNMLKDPELAEILIPQVGAIIALDALLNNVDRMPALWANDGNFSNVMLAPDGKKALGIDQQVNAITDATGRDRYFATVREFCQDAHHARLSCSNLSRLKEAFVVNTGIELTEDNIRSLLRGAEDVFARVRAESSTLKTSIRKLLLFVKGQGFSRCRFAKHYYDRFRTPAAYIRTTKVFDHSMIPLG